MGHIENLNKLKRDLPHWADQNAVDFAIPIIDAAIIEMGRLRQSLSRLGLNPDNPQPGMPEDEGDLD